MKRDFKKYLLEICLVNKTFFLASFSWCFLKPGILTLGVEESLAGLQLQVLTSCFLLFSSYTLPGVPSCSRDPPRGKH